MKYTCISFNILGIDEADVLGVEGSETGLYAPSGVRAGYIADFLERSGADIVGIQEAGSHHGLYDWQTNFGGMIEKSGRYGIVNIGNEPEYIRTTTTFADKKVPLSAGLMILYLKSRFELADSGAHRYSSKESQERYFQWAHLRDITDGRSVFVTNTHWSINRDENGRFSPEAGAANRTLQAEELLDFWKKEVGDNILFATGDYNCPVSAGCLSLLEKDIYRRAENATEPHTQLGPHIDNIFINSQLVNVTDCHFSKEKIDLSTLRPVLSPAYYWFMKEKQNAPHRFDRMSDHNPFIVTVETL